MSLVLPGALDAAAALIAAALGVEVAREPMAERDPPDPDPLGVTLAVALAQGPTGPPSAQLLGQPPAFEFEHTATLEIVALGGAEADRADAVTAALIAADAALAADPTLGGLVDFAELAGPDFSSAKAPPMAAVSVDLLLTFTAPSALG